MHRKTANYYPLSKTRAEKVAWALWQQTQQFDMDVICHSFTFGPMLQSGLNESCRDILHLIQRDRRRFSGPFVDVRDVAALQIAASESGGTGRRLICSAGSVQSHVYGQTLNEILPSLRLTTTPRDKERTPLQFDTSPSMGLLTKYRGLHETLHCTVESLVERGHLHLSSNL